jgi:putative Holliday junction resolvase
MLEIRLPSSIEYLPLVDSVCEAFCLWSGMDQDVTQEVTIAVVEAATNAVVHGNKCQRSKKMRAVFVKKPCEISISVSDEGAGFDPSKVADPTDESNVFKESGRGIYIMKQVMDKVEFDSTDSGGTRITLAKNLAPAEKCRVLCVDYGRKRLGLALSDEMGVTAQPFGTIEAEGEEEQLKQVEQVAHENGVTAIVVGLPLTLKGEVTQGASRVIDFARKLNQRLGVSVITWDERLSTKEGEKLLIESGMRRDKRKKVVDSVAAAIILRSYLDARSKT